MRIYQLKSLAPSWHFDPATFGQLKVLRFFGIQFDLSLTKGRASGIIGGLFSDREKKRLWSAYVFTTGDEEHTSTELRPHDRAALASVVIPGDWHPKRSPYGPNVKYRNGLEKVVGELLKEGSPFDDPIPEVPITGKCFCFTGRFEFGSRNECQQTVVSRGGSFTDNVTGKTDVLVIGNDANPTWSQGSYGNKIEAAMVNRMDHGKPIIISEVYWIQILES